MVQTVWVIVEAAEREQLAAIVADRNRPRKHVERARIVLASADRGSVQQVEHSIGVSRPTVWRWQQRFAERGVDGLLRDKTRKPGKAPMAAEPTARVVALTCTEPPHQASHWTGRAMAKAVGISLDSVQRIGRPKGNSPRPPRRCSNSVRLDQIPRSAQSHWVREILIAFQMRSGVAGSSMCSMPNSDSASTNRIRNDREPGRY